MKAQSVMVDLSIYPWQPPVEAHHSAYIAEPSPGKIIEPHALALTLSKGDPHETQIELHYFGDQHEALIDGLKCALDEIEFHASHPQSRVLME